MKSDPPPEIPDTSPFHTIHVCAKGEKTASDVRVPTAVWKAVEGRPLALILAIHEHGRVYLKGRPFTVIQKPFTL